MTLLESIRLSREATKLFHKAQSKSVIAAVLSSILIISSTLVRYVSWWFLIPTVLSFVIGVVLLIQSSKLIRQGNKLLKEADSGSN